MMERFRLDSPIETVSEVCTTEDIRIIREEVKTVFMHPEVREYLLKIVCATRKDSRIVAGASPRSTLAFMRASQALAAIRGRKFVTPDDVKELAPYLLGHRVLRNNRFGGQGNCWEDIRVLVSDIEVPVEKFGAEE